MMDQDLKYWIAISRIPKIGAARLKKIYNFFTSMEEAWRASFYDLKRAGLEEKIIENFLISRNNIDPYREWEKIVRENIKIITIKNKKFPKLLKEIWNPPSLLYYKGNLPLDDELTIAVVGSRKISDYGKQLTPLITKQLVLNNFTIVSGLALGVDSLSHEAAIKNKGKTIAVLGSGIDKNSIYPSQNKYLASEILEKGGAIISEYPHGTTPFPGNFPARNRIISGLSLGTLVIEAAKNSGTSITANCALDQNREVFAFPGNIFKPNSFGTNKLIKMGATVVTSIEDILEAFSLTNT